MSDGIRVFAETHPDPLGTIAMPMRDSISVETHTSLLKSDYRWTAGRPTNRIYVQGSQLPLQRNEAVMRMQGDWILFIDDDMVFDEGAIGQLVATYHTLKEHVAEPIIVGGLCVRRAPPHQPTLFKAADMEDGPFHIIEDWEGSDLVEVDATGAAFYLIETDVFSAIMGGPFPDYADRALLPPWPFYEWRESMGEDLRFCLSARAAGCRIFVDTRIRIGHVASKVATIEDFWHEVSVRPQEVEDAKRLMNDEAGLPTLSREEARERLDAQR